MKRETKEQIKIFFIALLPSILFAMVLGHDWWLG